MGISGRGTENEVGGKGHNSPISSKEAAGFRFQGRGCGKSAEDQS